MLKGAFTLTVKLEKRISKFKKIQFKQQKTRKYSVCSKQLYQNQKISTKESWVQTIFLAPNQSRAKQLPKDQSLRLMIFLQYLTSWNKNVVFLECQSCALSSQYSSYQKHYTLLRTANPLLSKKLFDILVQAINYVYSVLCLAPKIQIVSVQLNLKSRILNRLLERLNMIKADGMADGNLQFSVAQLQLRNPSQTKIQLVLILITQFTFKEAEKLFEEAVQNLTLDISQEEILKDKFDKGQEMFPSFKMSFQNKQKDYLETPSEPLKYDGRSTHFRRSSLNYRLTIRISSKEKNLSSSTSSQSPLLKIRKLSDSKLNQRQKSYRRSKDKSKFNSKVRKTLKKKSLKKKKDEKASPTLSFTPQRSLARSLQEFRLR